MNVPHVWRCCACHKAGGHIFALVLRCGGLNLSNDAERAPADMLGWKSKGSEIRY